MILRIVGAILGILFIVMGGYLLSDGQTEWTASVSMLFIGPLFLIYGIRGNNELPNLAPKWIRIDKVRFVATGSIVLFPLLIFYVWITLSEWLQHAEPTWLILTISLFAVLGVAVGWFVNPMISYRRNTDICVGGIPFPIHYGMPVEGGCISGHVVFRNFLLDVCYWCFAFIAMGLLIYTTGAEHGFMALFIAVGLLFVGIRFLLLNVLKIYPIRIEVEE